MSTSRRSLLQYSLATASLFALGPLAHAAPRRGGKKRILVLGGTRFLGPAIVRAAQARGHALTLFNRGKSRPGLFPDVDQLLGDRDPTKGEGLAALEGGTWDVVIDTSGFYPRIVRASAELLAPRVGQYIYISSTSAYARLDVPHQDERAPTATLADPTVETMGKDYEFYGGLKRACEVAAETAMPGRVTHVRPGYIVGPEDNSDRFTYWPTRFARGGEMLAPGTPRDPLQVIDVRDLGEWLVHLAEAGTTGVFNAVGPTRPLTMGQLFDTCRKVTGKDTRLTWVDADWLAQQGESGDAGIPIWMPPTGASAGAHNYSNARAVRAGLRFRPLAATVRDTLAWWDTLPEERRAKPRAGITPERERELLARWAEARAKKATGTGR